MNNWALLICYVLSPTITLLILVIHKFLQLKNLINTCDCKEAKRIWGGCPWMNSPLEMQRRLPRCSDVALIDMQVCVDL